MTCTAPRHLRDDEEPEQEWVTVSVFGRGLCTICGHADHRAHDCPNKGVPK